MEEYRELLKSGANMSFVQYANEKQSSQPKSYLQFVTDKRTGKPDVHSYGDTAAKAVAVANNIPNIRALGAGDYGTAVSERRLAEAREKYNLDSINNRPSLKMDGNNCTDFSVAALAARKTHLN